MSDKHFSIALCAVAVIGLIVVGFDVFIWRP